MSHRNFKYLIPKIDFLFPNYACTCLKVPYINKCQCKTSGFSCHPIQRQTLYLISVMRNISFPNYHPTPGKTHPNTITWAPMLTVELVPFSYWALLLSISNQQQSNSLIIILARSFDFWWNPKSICYLYLTLSTYAYLRFKIPSSEEHICPVFPLSLL